MQTFNIHPVLNIPVCPHCEKPKPFASFYKPGRRGVRRLGWCKQCWNARRKRERTLNEAQKQWIEGMYF
jgi:hypothetical protein